MGTAKFTSDGILDAAAAILRESGSASDVTINAIARRLSAPSGSIYHRFDSRDELLARLWLRSVDRFHDAYLTAGRQEDPEDALLAMAKSVASFTRDQPADAVAMTLYRQHRLVRTAPPSCRAAVAEINTGVEKRLAELAAQRYPNPTKRHKILVRVAAIDSPYGLVRPYVRDVVPEWLPSIIEASSRAVLALGDDPAMLRN
ncbi:TetR/AcrR family transcriptional regulator [Nonomuraea wenchangensis]